MLIVAALNPISSLYGLCVGCVLFGTFLVFKTFADPKS